MTSTPAMSYGKTPITILLGTSADHKLWFLSFEPECVSQSRGWGTAYSIYRDNLDALHTRLRELHHAETHDARTGAYTGAIQDLGKWGKDKITDVTDEHGSLMSEFLPDFELTEVYGSADETDYGNKTKCLRAQMECARPKLG